MHYSLLSSRSSVRITQGAFSKALQQLGSKPVWALLLTKYPKRQDSPEPLQNGRHPAIFHLIPFSRVKEGNGFGPPQVDCRFVEEL